MSIKNLFVRLVSFLVVGLLVLGAFARPQTGQAAPALQQPNPQDGAAGVFRGVSTAVRFAVSRPLRELAAEAAKLPPPVVTEVDRDLPSGLEGPLGPQDLDPLVQTWVGSAEMPAPIVSFDGPSNLAGVQPPDPVGDVGPNHYVAMSNLYSAVYDKAGNVIVPPFPNNALWSGFGGDCETDNSGDPIVVYDQLADRWMLTQFTASGPTYFNCVALSVTGDPAGSYYLWAFSTGVNFPDYPKYGVWPNAYYISTREFSGSSFVGVGAYALNRAQMLAGNPAPQVVSFLVPPGSQPYNVGDGLLPADLDGSTLPPPGSPHYFMGSMDDGASYGAPQDALTLWEFDLDWSNPGAATFTLQATIPTAPFDSIFPCSPNSRACIPQPGTTNKVDILSYRQRPLWRLAYRNFGSYETLVTNQSVEASPNMAGIRWYEVRSPNNSPYIYQQGTYAPGSSDGIHRWMGSIAMDRNGNIALGYSASDGTSTYPSVWYTGRLATDPLGLMPQGEGVIVNGSGSQTSGNRWGDYSSMNIDPVDDCTFWYVNEYYKTNGTNWWLRIGSFKFPSCTPGAAADLALDKAGEPQIVPPGGALTYTLSITNFGPSPISSTFTLANPALISIPSAGAANPYPSTIDASSLSGTVVKATVTLNDVSHTFPDDIDILLVGPTGAKTLLMSDAGGSTDLVNVDLTFDDDAPALLPDSNPISSGVYRPTDYGTGDTFPAPAPAGPYPASLAVFQGTNPAGNWNLYVVDDLTGDAGSIGGWSLTLTISPVKVEDTLPPGVAVAGISAPGWTCTQAGQLLTCTYNSTMPVGPVSPILIQATAPAVTGYITNTAEITHPLDQNPLNNLSASVTLVDTPPQAADDAYATDEDLVLQVSAPGVIGNDLDPDSDPLSVALLTPPAQGDLTLNPDGSFVYTPTLNFYGSDFFTYLLSDGYLTDTATAVIDVLPVNDAPSAVEDAYTTPEDTPLVVDPLNGLLANDSDPEGDPLAVVAVTIPQHGDLWIAADGAFVYTPTLNYAGLELITYTVSDGVLTDTALWTIEILPLNDPPLVFAGEDQVTDEGSLVQFSGVYTDPGLLLAPAAVEIFWDFGDGNTASGSLTPTHIYADDGLFTVTLIITDDLGGVGSDTLLVAVNNLPPALAPLPDLAVTVGQVFTVTGLYTDPGLLDAQLLVIEWQPGLTETLNLPAGGGLFDVVHAYAQPGVYLVTLTITDDDGASSAQTFTVTVEAGLSRVYLPVILK